MERKPFIKMRDIRNNQFRVLKVVGTQWKMWDTKNNKMLVSEMKQDGFKKVWTLELPTGVLDMSESHFGQMCALYYDTNNGVNIEGKDFYCWWNKQEGLDARYKMYAPRVWDDGEQPSPQVEEEVNIDDIEF